MTLYTYCIDCNIFLLKQINRQFKLHVQRQLRVNEVILRYKQDLILANRCSRHIKHLLESVIINTLGLKRVKRRGGGPRVVERELTRGMSRPNKQGIKLGV